MNEFSVRDGRLLLVLDDWHAIHNSDIVDSISFFLEYLPSTIHLCIASRNAEAFPKARWYSREWMRDIRVEQLRFDLAETVDFFRLHAKQDLSRELVESYLQQTEGWVTGLKLISFALREDRRPPAPLRPEPRAAGRVERYLLEEVFVGLDEETRTFLMEVSVLQRLSGPLCDAVAGPGGAERLADLARLRMFLIPLDEREEWFRFHHLFSEFLQARQRKLRPERTAVLYRNAARWCESRELLEEAVDYYLAGQCFEDAIRLLEQMKSMMVRRQFSSLKMWLSSIPEPMLQRHPFLYFSYIYSLLWGGEPDLAERHLERAEQYVRTASARWDEAQSSRYLGDLYYIRNFQATQYEMDMVKGLHYIRLSMQYSPTGTDLLFASPQTPLVPTVYRSYNGKRGNHLPRGLADDFFRNMIEFMSRMDLQHSVVVCYGELLYERNELDESERQLKLVLQDASPVRYQPEKVYLPAYFLLSRIARARKDGPQAERWLEEAGKRALEEGTDEALPLVEAEMAALRLEAGDAEAAQAWKERYKLSEEDPVSVFQLYTYSFLARVLLEAGAPRNAWKLTEKLLPIAVKGHRPMDALEIETLQAMILKAEGKLEQALLKLEEALAYAEPDDYVRVFVDKGAKVATLLAEYVQQRQRGNLRDKRGPSLSYVRKLLAAFGGDAATPSERNGGSLPALLTPRELAVFRAMEEGMDNAAIARSLGIGMGTLKTHINHIYSKLQATNRVEAINRGKKMLHL
jgi:LuxR family maltose regulon positive regulatory protein